MALNVEVWGDNEERRGEFGSCAAANAGIMSLMDRNGYISLVLYVEFSATFLFGLGGHG